MNKFHKALTTVLGLGYAPIAPGTFGSIGAFFCCYLIAHFQGVHTYNIFILITSIILTVIGIWSTDKLTPEWGEDPSKVVLDEYIGYLITLFLVPFTLKNLLIALLLFRFFDILKPLGIRYIDKNVKGGTGVMLDDVLAGIYACASLHLWIWIEPRLF